MADRLHGKNSRQMAEGHQGHHHLVGATNVATRKISAPAGVCRTTSETIRLGPSGAGISDQLYQHHAAGQSLGSSPATLAQLNNNTQPTTNNNNNNAARKKTSSFQITSVTVGCRMSNDGGEDSNDDLDESHTEDNNSVEHSRITDIETPTSYSEETFSKDDVFFNANNAALSTAPVIPTSSQYGLAIVPSTEANNVTVNNSTGEHNNICNSLDIASVTDNDIINLLSSSGAKQDVDLREVHSHGRNERFKVVKIESTEPFKRGRWTCMDYLDQTSVNQPTVISQSKSDPNEVCISYGVTDTGIVVPDTTNTSPKPVVDDQQQQQQTQQQKVVNVIEQQNGPLTSPEVQPSPIPVSISVSNNSPQTPQYAVNATIPNQQQPQYFQTPPPASAPTQQQPQQPQISPNPQAGATLPSNLQQQPPQQQHAQSLPQGSIPLMNPQVTPPIHSKDEQPTTAQAGPGQPTASPQQVPQQIAPSDQQQPMMHLHTVPQTQQQQQGGPGTPQQPQVQQTTPQQQQQQSGTPTNAGQMPGPQVQIGATVVGFHQAQQQPPDQEQDSMAGMVVAGGPVVAPGQSIADSALLESLAEVTHNPEDPQTHEDNESMSGTSAVAIDNKIEQAMDLVKSHLMFAVREEVEVLKEKIAELMDRINQLEAENSILKAHATPETLAQLSQVVVAAKLPINNTGSGQ